MAELHLLTPEELAAREQQGQGTRWRGRRSPERTRLLEAFTDRCIEI